MSFETLIQKAYSAPGYSKYEGYYNGTRRLDKLGVSLPPQMRVLEIGVNWPRLSVEVMDEALNVEGFRTADSALADKLRTWWQANNLDTRSHLAHTEALIHGHSFVVVGRNTDPAAPPVITVHSSQGTGITYGPLGEVTEAVQVTGSEGETQTAAHYQPWKIDYYTKEPNHAWKLTGTEYTGIAQVPVVPLVNRPRIDKPLGESEMTDIIQLADAAARSLTNLQVAQENLALPQRVIIGMAADELKDSEQKPISKLKAYISSLWVLPEDTKVDQFAGADLSQIINSVKLYAQMVGSAAGIPPSFLGIQTDNPASAEAMRVAKERLISKAERRQSSFGDSWELVMRIALALAGEPLSPGDMLETLWRDPATPSRSAKTASALQAHAQGLITAHTARELMDLTPEQRAYEDSNDDSVRNMLGG